MSKNINIGGRSYREPAKNLARISTKGNQAAAVAREKHEWTMKLKNHIETCPACKKSGPANCPSATEYAREFRARFSDQKSAE